MGQALPETTWTTLLQAVCCSRSLAQCCTRYCSYEYRGQGSGQGIFPSDCVVPQLNTRESCNWALYCSKAANSFPYKYQVVCHHKSGCYVIQYANLEGDAKFPLEQYYEGTQ